MSEIHTNKKVERQLGSETTMELGEALKAFLDKINIEAPADEKLTLRAVKFFVDVGDDQIAAVVKLINDEPSNLWMYDRH